VTAPQTAPEFGRGAFDDRVVIVTGSSKGIGRAMAIGYAHAGASVVVSSRDAERCQPVVDEIIGQGGTAHAIAAHMGRPDDIDGLAAATIDHFGRIDVVVNNAAVNPHALSLLEMPDELTAKLFAANVTGPLRLARLAAVDMIPRGRGAILNITSHAAVDPEPNLGPYAATKAALVTLNKVMALEWAEYGIRVNAIAPGPFATVMVDELFKGEYRDALLASTAQRRIAAPDEIVGAALFLTGDDATFITGAVLAVDGGMVP
jgi:NAD(P)-dependent dehydrogenase (short-subunit alcohol dehydrogenase family)